jgi:hypothetical protein
VAPRIVKYLLASFGVAVLVVIILYQGLPINPLHDFNHWMFDRHYQVALLPHPDDSVLLASKSYFGGPDDHGSWTCVYAAGEFRSSSLTKAELKQRYATSSIVSVYGFKKIPVQILFPDEPATWSLNYPLGDWWSDFSEQAATATTTIYFLYAEEKYPFGGDVRCDD